MKSYKELEVYLLSFQLAKEVHFMTQKLPLGEKYELGSQVRRSAQSIRANIVEGYGRRRYKKDFIHFLIQAYGSLLETTSHIEMLSELYPEKSFSDLHTRYDSLGARLNSFITYVENHWKT